MTMTVELVVLGSLGVVGLVAVCTMLLVVWCESAGETQHRRKPPHARKAAKRGRVSEPSAATSIEKALVRGMTPGSNTRLRQLGT